MSSVLLVIHKHHLLHHSSSPFNNYHLNIDLHHTTVISIIKQHLTRAYVHITFLCYSLLQLESTLEHMYTSHSFVIHYYNWNLLSSFVLFILKFNLHTNGFLKFTTTFIYVKESTKRIVLKFH
jgi:hypothetical protein